MSPLDRLRSGLGLTRGDLTVALFLSATAIGGYLYCQFFEDSSNFQRRVGMARLLATADSISRQGSMLGLSALSDSLTPDWNPLSREEVIEEGTDGEGRVELSLEDVAPIDINSAPVEILELLPGVGEKTALKIVQERPFASVEDITRVHGIGPKKLDKMRPYIVASGFRREGEEDSSGVVGKSGREGEPANGTDSAGPDSHPPAVDSTEMDPKKATDSTDQRSELRQQRKD